VRFGLAGTGHWARITHAPALASTEGAEFTAVWGRNQQAAAALAGEYGVTAHTGLDSFLAGVDAVAFSVPPDVQAAIATRAAAAGKHLLLEKPVAISQEAADGLVDAVAAAGVASVVFFTARFQAGVRTWLAGAAARGGWAGGSAVWLGTALQQANPFNTPWRREHGGLWDLGPHAVSLLWAGLGPVTSVLADAGPGDVSHLILHHASGVTSTVTVTLAAPEAAAGLRVCLWGEAGTSAAPVLAGQPLDPLRTALAELVQVAGAGQVSHPCDVRFGRDVGRVLAEAQRQISARRPPG
jgi:predicted dehydrogenase